MRNAAFGRGEMQRAAGEKCRGGYRACSNGEVKENVGGGGGGGGDFLLVLQEDEGSSLVSQRAARVTFRYWGRNFATVAIILS